MRYFLSFLFILWAISMYSQATFSLGPIIEVGFGTIKDKRTTEKYLESSDPSLCYGLSLGFSNKNFEMEIQLSQKNFIDDLVNIGKFYYNQQDESYLDIKQFNMSRTYGRFAPKWKLINTKLVPFVQVGGRLGKVEYFTDQITYRKHSNPEYFKGTIISMYSGADISIGIQPLIGKNKNFEMLLGANYTISAALDDNYTLNSKSISEYSLFLGVRRVW